MLACDETQRMLLIDTRAAVVVVVVEREYILWFWKHFGLCQNYIYCTSDVFCPFAVFSRSVVVAYYYVAAARSNASMDAYWRYIQGKKVFFLDN